jgi:DNA-binding CsgD family transcriptional regulator
MGEPKDTQASQSQPVTLTPQQAEILLKADLANLARKVQQGKTLSAAERNLVQSILGGGDVSTANYADNQVELAKILNVDRKTIQRYRKLPGNPGARADGRWDVNAWRTFIARRRG